MKPPIILSLFLLASAAASADDLTDALDLPGANWQRGSTGSPWHAGADAQDDYAEVTDLPLNAEAWLETSVSGPGILSVTAQVPVSSTGIEYHLRVSRDGEDQLFIPAANPAQIAVPAGSHTMRITISAPWHSGNPGGNHTVRVRSVALQPNGTFAAEALDTPGRDWFAMGWGRSWEVLPTGHDGVDSLFVDSGEYATLETLVTGPATIAFWQKYSSTEEGDASLNVTAAESDLGWQWGTDFQRLQAWVPPGDHWVRWSIEGDGGHLNLDEFTVSPSAGVSLAEATDTIGQAGIGTWTTSEAVPWTGSVTPVAGDGVDFAAVATREYATTQPWIQTTAQGPGRLRWTGSGGARPLLFMNGAFLATSTIYAGETTSFLPAGTNTLRWTASESDGYAALDRVQFDVFGQTTAAEALDAPGLTFTTGGSAPPAGVVTAVEAHDGTDYLLFPTILDGGDSWVETTVAGPGTLEFHLHQVASSYGTISITKNGAPLTSVAATPWHQVHVELPPGPATIRWSFTTLVSGAAILDGVSWTPAARPFSDALEFSDWTLIASGYAVDAGALKPVSSPLMLRLAGSGAGIMDIVPQTGDGTVTLTSPADSVTRNASWNAPTIARLFLDSGDHELEFTVRNGAIERVTLTNQPVTLGEALDAPGQVFTTGGDGTWRGYAFPDALAGGDSAASPQIARGQNAWMETSFTGPGFVNFSVRQMVFDPDFKVVMHVAGSPAAETVPGASLTTQPFTLAIPAGVHSVRWEVRRSEPLFITNYGSPYALVDSLTFTSSADIPAALDAPGRAWRVFGTISAGEESGEDIAVLGGGTLSTIIDGPATVAFRWKALGSLNVQWISLNSGSLPGPTAGSSWQNAQLILPAGQHRIDWTGSGTLDAVSVTQETPLANAIELRGIDWHAIYLSGAWDSVSEDNRLNGTVLRSRLTAPGTNRLSVFCWHSGGPLSFDWRRSSSAAGASSFGASAAPSNSIPPAGITWATASLQVLYGWRELVWTHTSISGSNEEARLDAVTTSPESYFRWANARGIGHVSQEADSDGDGVTDIFEFATGSNPVSAASAIQPVPEFLWQPGGTLRILWTFPAPPYDTSGLRWILRGSEDLQTWWESPVTPAPYAGQLTVGTITGQSARAFHQLRLAYEP